MSGLKSSTARRPWQSREKNGNWKGGRVLASNGYVLVRVGVNHHLADVRGYAYEHRIVAEMILGRRLQTREVVHHINGDTTDNRPENLEMATHAENAQHAVRVLKVGRTANQDGQKNHASKLTDSQVEAVRLLYAAGSMTQKQIAEQFGVRHQCISKIVRWDSRKKNNGPTADYTANRSRGGGNRRFRS